MGKRTPLYPHGYGYCQDGCGKITRLIITEASPNGVWASYIENHQPERDALQSESSSREIVPPQTETKTPIPAHSPISGIAESEDFAKECARRAVDPTTLKSTGYGHRPKARKEAPFTLSPKSYVETDKKLLDLYLNLKGQHEQLLLNVDLMRLDIEGVINWIDEIWKGSEDGKRLVIDRLRTAISTLKSMHDKKRGIEATRLITPRH